MDKPNISRRELLIQVALASRCFMRLGSYRHFRVGQARKSCLGWISLAPIRAAAWSKTCSRGKTSRLHTSRRMTNSSACRTTTSRRSMKEMESRDRRAGEEAETLTLPAIKARPKQEVVYTIECGGNHGFPWFTSGIGTAKWGGTPLAPLLKQAGVMERGSEVVFWGADSGSETIRDMKLPQHFARSMSLADAMSRTICFAIR